MSDKQHNAVAFTDVAGPTQGKTGARFKWSFTIRTDDPEELAAQLHHYEQVLISAGCIPFDAYVDQRRNGRAQEQPPQVEQNGNGQPKPPPPPSGQTEQPQAGKTGRGKLISLTIQADGKAEFVIDGLRYPLKDSRGPEAIAGLFDPSLNWEPAHFAQPVIYTEKDFGQLWLDWKKPGKYYDVARIYSQA